MRLLVIDTALTACTAAVFEGAQRLAARSEVMARGHAERIGGFVRDAMNASGLTFADMDRIGVTVGPGSFTGLRVGLAFAQGLGAALDLPVVGLGTLTALAASDRDGGEPLAAVVDARRGEVYLQIFEGGEPVSAPEALIVEAARERIVAASVVHAIGSGAALVGLAASEVLDPTPEGLARLTARLDPQVHAPRPLYLRAPDATPPTRLPGQPRVSATA